jgi:hypothetical protein
MKITTISMLSILSAALLFSACSSAGNTTANTSTTNTSTTTTTNKSNTAVVANTNQTAVVNNTAPVSNTAPTPAAGQSEASQIEGELQVGKTESVILYVGMESGDYAGYCFTNGSEAGRAILAACKDREQCAVSGTIDYEGDCKVPGLEATLSESGRISKVQTVKSRGRKK